MIFLNHPLPYLYASKLAQHSSVCWRRNPLISRTVDTFESNTFLRSLMSYFTITIWIVLFVYSTWLIACEHRCLFISFCGIRNHRIFEMKIRERNHHTWSEYESWAFWPEENMCFRIHWVTAPDLNMFPFNSTSIIHADIISIFALRWGWIFCSCSPFTKELISTKAE